MKRLLTLCLAASLTSCATDPATGRQSLSPEMNAALNRIGVSTLNAAEAALVLKLNEVLVVQSSGK